MTRPATRSETDFGKRQDGIAGEYIVGAAAPWGFSRGVRLGEVGSHFLPP